MMDNCFPRILIISRGVWDDSQGTSSTLTNFFEDYKPEMLAHIYIETKAPNTICCYRFFQISEYSLIKKLWCWGIKTGYAFDTRKDQYTIDSLSVAKQEVATMDYVRTHRSIIFSSLREILWGLNGWKSKDLKLFIRDFNPDVIWMDGSPLPFMYRLYDYILKIANKPATIFLQDDVYTYLRSGLWRHLRRYHLRQSVKKTIKQCSNVFVASPKMKREYDAVFGVNSTFISKSFRMNSIVFTPTKPHQPLRLVYMGQVIYGRIKTLIDIAEAMKVINKNEAKCQLFIYTNNRIEEKDAQLLLSGGNVFLKNSVPYSEVPDVIADNDVLVFVETFDSKLNKIARLSFSTKISDYLKSGKCVLAIGPGDLAPIEYFREEDAALVATDSNEILDCLSALSQPGVVEKYSVKANACALKNHERAKMNRTIYGRLDEIAEIQN